MSDYVSRFLRSQNQLSLFELFLGMFLGWSNAYFNKEHPIEGVAALIFGSVLYIFLRAVIRRKLEKNGP